MKAIEKEAPGVPDASWSVNEVIATYPDSVRVFNAFGVDSCCHGDDTLDQAARSADLEADVLVCAVREALVPEVSSGSES
jgi:iron-sulfur cluster repair protein YtfE (RIC family)